MELYVSEFSKYIITLLIALYTYECFAVFRFDDELRRRVPERYQAAPGFGTDR